MEKNTNKLHFLSLFFYMFNVAIHMSHQKFVTADVTAVFVNN